uniref:Uncharacterized protein n=1 Tax=Glossina pallidipes TaxID=7398 RepID=A0A1A9ZZE7_GLOPL
MGCSHAKGRCVDRSKEAKCAFGDKTVIPFQKDGKEFIAIDGQCCLISFEGKKSLHLYGSSNPANSKPCLSRQSASQYSYLLSYATIFCVAFKCFLRADSNQARTGIKATMKESKKAKQTMQ